MMYKYFAVIFAVIIFITIPIILSTGGHGTIKTATELPHKPRHILNLSRHEKQEFLNSFHYIFSDIDGVVWNMFGNIEGAPNGFTALKKAGKNCTFISNNSVRTVPICLEKFRSLNMDVIENDIWHPARTTMEYLQSIKFDGLIYIIACEAFKRILRDAGFKLIDGPNKLLEESFTDLARNIFDKQPVRAVIMDTDFNLSTAKLIKAHIYLKHPECLLIVGATDMLMPIRPEFNVLGPGPFAKIIAEASNKEMLVMGKPGKQLCETLIENYGIKNSDQALMIGDMLEQDIGFGKLCGFQTLLVLSGGCTLAALQAEKNPLRLPDYYADSMGDFVEFFNDLNTSNM